MFLLNTLADQGRRLDERDERALGSAAAAEVERWLAMCPSHRETPFPALPAVARELGVKHVAVKDEGARLGLGSFKALGGAYAVIRLVLEAAGARLGRVVEPHELREPEIRAVAATLTVGCATAGNHGRSVAAGARLVGCRAAIFMHAGVDAARVAAIAALGAKIVRVEGTYDDAVAEASRVCAAEGWTVVSDTSWPGYERIPLLVMQGYTAMVAEALRAAALPPTHVFLQAGVGGFAAAVAGHVNFIFSPLSFPARQAKLAEGRESGNSLGKDGFPSPRAPSERSAGNDTMPRIVVVEPARAACLLESCRAGRPVRIAANEPSVMATLDCHEPSLVAWRVLSRTASAFMTVDEDDAVAAARRALSPAAGDPAISTTPSGAAGLAGLVRACGNADIRAALGLSDTSRVLVFNTEGAMT